MECGEWSWKWEMRIENWEMRNENANEIAGANAKRNMN